MAKFKHSELRLVQLTFDSRLTDLVIIKFFFLSGLS